MAYTQERVGNYIRTYTGKKFYAFDPRPEDICIEDIAHSLSNLCRFTGHGTRFYSVAEHSIFCAIIGRNLMMSPLRQLYLLLHDATESIVNDLARPIKQDIPHYKEIENNIEVVIWDALGLPHPTEQDYEIIKKVDNTMLVIEMEDLMPHSKEDIPYYIDRFNVKLTSLEDEVGTNYEIRDAFLELYNAFLKEYKGDSENDTSEE